MLAVMDVLLGGGHLVWGLEVVSSRGSDQPRVSVGVIGKEVLRLGPLC
jgi:hypothetical protein